jgi:hypothetical protein
LNSPNGFVAFRERFRGFGKHPSFYRLAAGGGTGTFVTPWHFPLPVLLPIRRPDASRWVPVSDPEGLAFVVWLPVSRPEASRYWVFVAEPLPVRVSALPAKRPLASR